MQIQVNGKTHTFEQGLAIGQLLTSLQLDPQRVVVERNREIVPRKEFAATLLADGDQLEILHFVGGG